MEAVLAIQANQGTQKGLMIFSYEGIKLGKNCSIGGEPCTSRAIGEWLNAKYPDKYVRKILERNPHIKQYATRIKLPNDEGGRNVTREVEVFNAIGLIKLFLIKTTFFLGGKKI